MRFLMLLTALAAAPLACPAQPMFIMEKPPDWVEVVEHNIPYGPYPQTVLDIMRKRGLTGSKRPGVLVIHGGGWIAQRKERNVAAFCLPFLERGFVAANVEYRLAEVAPAPAAVTDVLEATAWFREHAAKYGVDPNKIVVTGESAGAHLALMVAMTPRSAHLGPAARVAAVVDKSGISDVASMLTGPKPVRSAEQWIPDQPGRLELARRVSPITYVRPGLPPILIIHGDKDGSVPYQQATMLEKALREQGVDTELITVPNGDHRFPVETWDRLLPQIFDFLAQRGIRGTPGPGAGTSPAADRR